MCIRDSPLRLTYGERVRLVLVNDTMMTHPIHLHGMWSDLEDEEGKFKVRKHTVDMPPGSRRSYRVTADALGRWAYHCHLLFHMEAGLLVLGLMRNDRNMAAEIVVAIPDADVSLEAFAKDMPAKLVAAGATVLIPQIMDRQATFSGLAGARLTDKPPPQFLWRRLYSLGGPLVCVAKG